MRQFMHQTIAVLVVAAVWSSLPTAQAQQFKGKITPDQRRVVYEIKMQGKSTYIIDLESEAFDTFLEVRNPENKIIAKDDDGGDGLNSKLMFKPAKTATFKVVARPLFGSKNGPFTLTVRKAILIANGKLTKQDAFDRVRPKARHKSHTVKLIAGNRYVIDLVSRDFDPYLRVEDAGGTNLAHDDDSGSGLNSRLTFAPKKTGNYRIIATAYGGGNLGAYTLSVSK